MTKRPDPDPRGGCLGCIAVTLALIVALVVATALVRLTFVAMRWAWSLL